MKKRVIAMIAALSLGILPLTACQGEGAPVTEPEAPVIPASFKVLFIGNSFSMDTVEYLAQIAQGCGVKEVLVANLYQGGCSIQKHEQQARNNSFSYEYSTNNGNEWTERGRTTIDLALKADNWDWVVIQHGTADGSRYAEEASYEKLPALVQHVKERVSEDTKIAFNMTWVGERNSHQELIAYANNQERYYNAIAALTKDTVATTEGIDLVVPTGTAIYNARTTTVRPLFRDGYHLSLDSGRYIAGLTFFAAVTGVDVSEVTFVPEGLSAYAKAAAIESAMNAVKTPYEQTASTLKEVDYE